MGEPSSDATIKVSRDGSIVTLQLNRPDRMNAVSLDLYRALDSELESLADDPGTRAVILTGSGRAFCVGADLDAHARGTGGEDAREGVESFLQKRAPNFQLKVSSDLPDFLPWWEEPGYDDDV